MKRIIQPLLVPVWLSLLAACATQGPTDPEWTRQPPETFESRGPGAAVRVCHKRPPVLAPAMKDIPIYRCR